MAIGVALIVSGSRGNRLLFLHSEPGWLLSLTLCLNITEIGDVSASKSLLK